MADDLVEFDVQSSDMICCFFLSAFWLYEFLEKEVDREHHPECVRPCLGIWCYDVIH